MTPDIQQQLGDELFDALQARRTVPPLTSRHPEIFSSYPNITIADQQPEVAEVLTVGGGVLTDQVHLQHTLLDQPGNLADHVWGSPGDEGSAERWDGTEGTAAVAPGGQLHRRDRAFGQPPAGADVTGQHREIR